MSTQMSPQEIVQQIRTAWSEGDANLADEYMAEDFVGHMLGEDELQGREAYKQWLRETFEAFPDAHVEFDPVFVRDDVICGAWTFTGTHEGPYPGLDVEPTGKSVEMEGMFIDRLEDGKVVELWHLSDTVTMLQQLGMFEA